MVFPTCTKRKKIKIQASGVDISSDTMFRSRLGMSGTPSSMEWPGLDYAVYNERDQSMILRTLTDPTVIDVFGNHVFMNWTVGELLRQIATSGRLHALIDAGALITGLDNLEVAKVLLVHLPESFKGVVYLSESNDAQRLYTRQPDENGNHDVLLKDARVPTEARFTFFDQVRLVGRVRRVGG